MRFAAASVVALVTIAVRAGGPRLREQSEVAHRTFFLILKGIIMPILYSILIEAYNLGVF